MAKRTRKTRGRRPASLAGTHLYANKWGVYVWRAVHPLTGRRVSRSTGQRRLDLALREAGKFEEDLAREAAGLKVLDGWRQQLAPLAERWFTALEDELSEAAAKTLRAQLGRALSELRLKTCADLDRVADLDDRLRRLGKAKGYTKLTLRRSFQGPLKRFSRWLAANRRYLERDPLLCWETIKAQRRAQTRRALLPDEVARAFLALDFLDAKGKRQPQRVPFLLMLVAAPRPGALLERDVGHYLADAQRIELGEDRGKKRRGEAALDPATAAELEGYVGDRVDGPLVLSPKGGRQDLFRFTDLWRDAVSLAVVDDLWPRDEIPELEVAAAVARTLRTGKVRVRPGGNPKRVHPDTVLGWVKLEKRVGDLADRLRETWGERLEGVDSHGFRTTHRSWAEAEGVPPVLSDKQLGHVERGGGVETLRLIAGSATGRRHYLDTSSAELFDARRSARAVRALLDRAAEVVRDDPRSMLAEWARRQDRASASG